jgi:hypothetical protein
VTLQHCGTLRNRKGEEREEQMNKAKRAPRWGTRLEAMAHGRVGATTMNQWLQGNKLVAKKVGKKVLVDLNSVDDLIESLPNVGDE